MTTDQLYEKMARRGLDPVAVEVLRRRIGGAFMVEHRRPEGRLGFDDEELRDRSLRGMLPRLHRVEPLILISRERAPNIVTNQGLDYWLDAALSGATPITAWYVGVSKSNTTPLSSHTYASPGYTEIAGTDVDETTRQAWTDAGVSSQSLTNAASPAVYTAKATWTGYGSSIKGGGSAPTTLANTAGGGKLYASALYASSKAMADNDTLTITYVLGSADDGV